MEYNFKIGDYVKISEKYKTADWYTSETYRIIKIEEDIMIFLDRDLPIGYCCVSPYNRVYISKIKLDISKMRNEKIKSLCSK